MVKILDQDREERDVLSMLTLVNQKVVEEYESSSSRREFSAKKQTPFIYSTLTYKLYLDTKKKEGE